MDTSKIIIKETSSKDFDALMEVEKLAFGSDEEAKLLANLLDDKTAAPLLSLLAFYNNEAVGHILYTSALIEAQNDANVHLLAPLAIKPAFQKQGIGGMLIKRGLQILTERGTELVFVLGHIDYYPKYGFINDAGNLGFEAPYPIPEIHADAWMVQELKAGALTKYRGKIKCANKIMKPEYWSE